MSPHAPSPENACCQKNLANNLERNANPIQAESLQDMHYQQTIHKQVSSYVSFLM